MCDVSATGAWSLHLNNRSETQTKEINIQCPTGDPIMKDCARDSALGYNPHFLGLIQLEKQSLLFDPFEHSGVDPVFEPAGA